MGEVVLGEILPSFERPPVTEAAAGVHFLQLPGLNTVGLVRVAHELWGARFPIVIEQPALPPLVSPGKDATVAFQLQIAPPPIRLWLLTDDQALLIQLQHDRLLLNWRKVKEDDPYPSYESLRAQYSELWIEFSSYVGRMDFGVLDPSFTEVSFFNRISTSADSTPADTVRALNPNWVSGRDFTTGLQLEREVTTNGLEGHQIIAVNHQPKSGFLHMEITTRIGLGNGENGIPALMKALDAAHHVGVVTFDDVTTEEVHLAWGKHNDRNT